MFFRKKKKSALMGSAKLEERPILLADDSFLKCDNFLIGGVSRASCKKSSDDAKQFICFLLDNNYKFNAFRWSEDGEVIIGCDTCVLCFFCIYGNLINIFIFVHFSNSTAVHWYIRNQQIHCE